MGGSSVWGKSSKILLYYGPVSHACGHTVCETAPLLKKILTVLWINAIRLWLDWKIHLFTVNCSVMMKILRIGFLQSQSLELPTVIFFSNFSISGTDVWYILTMLMLNVEIETLITKCGTLHYDSATLARVMTQVLNCKRKPDEQVSEYVSWFQKCWKEKPKLDLPDKDDPFFVSMFVKQFIFTGCIHFEDVSTWCVFIESCKAAEENKGIRCSRFFLKPKVQAVQVSSEVDPNNLVAFQGNSLWYRGRSFGHSMSSRRAGVGIDLCH